MKSYLSHCCNMHVTVEMNDLDGTAFYQCLKCGKVCDVYWSDYMDGEVYNDKGKTKNTLYKM